MRGRILAVLVPVLLLSACGGREVSLEELRQQAVCAERGCGCGGRQGHLDGLL